MTTLPPVNGTFERARWWASADHWDRWADPMADMADRLNQPLLDAAGVGPGDRVLDLACGAGEPALGAARRVGPDGLVVATDLVPAMMAGAVRRAAGVPVAPAFASADMTRLPFPDGCFDRTTCRFGVMFVPDVGAAAAELRRVLRAGGRAALMVWGPKDGNTLFDTIAAAVAARVGADAASGIDPLFRFAAPGVLAGALADAGFRGATETDLTPTRTVLLGQPFWKPPLEMSFGPVVSALPAPAQAALEAEVERRFAERADGGRVSLALHARIVTATA